MNKAKSIGVSLVTIFFIMVGLTVYFPEKDLTDQYAGNTKSLLPSLPNPFLQKLLANYEGEMIDLLNETKTPGLAIAIVKDSTVIFLKGFGVRQVGTSDSVNVHTVFRLASVSKCFAPVLTGLLVEDNVLYWDDYVIQHVPDFKLKSKEKTDSVKLTHLLSHTTGLPYHTYTTLVEDGIALKQMVAELQNVNLIAKPGEIYSYQNVAYSIIAEVIRLATGKPYETLMEEKIFGPLNMTDASLTYQAIMQNANVAKPHLRWRKGWRTTSISDTYYNVPPAGGVNASISDMSEWLKVMLGTKKEFISNKTLDKIFTPAIKAKTKNRYFRKWIGRSDSYYALGWRVLNFKHDTLLYHGGYVSGYRSEVAIDRKNKIGICVLSNGPGKLIDNSVPMFFSLFYSQRDSIMQWEKKPLQPAPVVKRKL